MLKNVKLLYLHNHLSYCNEILHSWRLTALNVLAHVFHVVIVYNCGNSVSEIQNVYSFFRHLGFFKNSKFFCM